MKRKRHRKNGSARDGVESTAIPVVFDTTPIQHGKNIPAVSKPSHRIALPNRTLSSPSEELSNKKQKSESLLSHTKFISRSGKKYITSTDGSIYHDLLKEHYVGFSYIPASQVAACMNPSNSSSTKNDAFHMESQRALEALRDAGYYQYDIVMAGGQHLSRTFVQRTLVGDPGLTYKYLGLRLFTHAWKNDTNPEGLRNPIAVSPFFRNVYNLNEAMIRMTQCEVQKYERLTGKKVPQSSFNYNLTLINYMESYNETLLRDEEFYGMGKASVSWHADSSLQDHSCIGVYHILPAETSKSNPSVVVDWKIAVRPNPPVESKHHPPRNSPKVKNAAVAVPPPPVVVSTKSGDVYFLLNEFNHTHQHMVLAGSNGRRISSTHRVAVTESDTYAYIAGRCSKALLSAKAELKKSSAVEWNVSILLEAQEVLTEVEFEWIAQYWIQGAQHDVQHVWWQGPMRALEQAWLALEKVTYKVYTRFFAAEGTTDLPPRSLVQGMLSALEARQEWRTKWDHRRVDKIYKRRISPAYQPVERPSFSVEHSSKQLPKDLTESIEALRNLLNSAFTVGPASESKRVAKFHPRRKQSHPVSLVLK
jgi:mRNA N6-methyladenine demethylase